MERVVGLLSVGPSDREIGRLEDFFAAIFHWENRISSVVLIDDAVEPRGLAERFTVPPGVRIHSISHPRRGEGEGVWGGLVEGILRGLARIATHEADATTVLKIDTDALVIGPFAQKAAGFFETHPRTGLIGLYDRHCSGEPRSFWPWNRAIFNYSLPIGTQRTVSGGRRLRWQLFNKFGEQRRILRRARARGYSWGEHCLGGAYILRGETVRDLHRQGLLEHAAFWRSSLVGEDVVVAAYPKAAGWEMSGFAEAGEIFGIAYVGLPFSPAELESRGYSVIHSVKNHPGTSEEDIRSFFQGRRVVREVEPAS